jgi:hypothetical protein
MAKTTLCSADPLADGTGGAFAAGAESRLFIAIEHAVTEQTVSGVGQETHATAGHEAGATDLLARRVKNTGKSKHNYFILNDLHCTSNGAYSL